MVDSSRPSRSRGTPAAPRPPAGLCVHAPRGGGADGHRHLAALLSEVVEVVDCVVAEEGGP